MKDNALEGKELTSKRLLFSIASKEKFHFTLDSKLEKVATAWKELWRAGELGAESLERLGINSAIKPATNEAMKGSLSDSIRQYLPPNVKELDPLSFYKNRNHLGLVRSSVNSLRDDLPLFQKEKLPENLPQINSYLKENEKVTNSLNSNTENVWNISSYEPNPNFVISSNTPLPKWKQLLGKLKNVYSTPWGNNGLNEPFYYSADEMSLPNPELHGIHPDNATAIEAHEMGHKNTLENPQLGNNTAKRIMPYMGFKPNGDDLSTEAEEAIAQFSATRNPGSPEMARLSTQLPIDKMKLVYPQKYNEWNQELNHLPEPLKSRLLAARSHLLLNYQSAEPTSAFSYIKSLFNNPKNILPEAYSHLRFPVRHREVEKIILLCYLL